MLGIGMQEIIIILVVALIVIGPKRLPELAKTLGKGFAEFRKAADDLQETVRLDLQKEKTEEFRQKYPDMVPEEDEEDPWTARFLAPIVVVIGVISVGAAVSFYVVRVRNRYRVA